MITFALVLSLMLNGERHTFVMDSGLSASDCAATLEANPAAPLRCELEPQK